VPELRQLAHAIDTRSRICIDYVSAAGGATRRVIDQPELIGASLHAWCELRTDDRVFTISRIRSVTAV
jgi:predicted DNA-binding transcriptional regulator YafY